MDPLHHRDAGAPSKHRHPELAAEGVAGDAEELAATVSSQAMNKQAEENGGQDLAQQHGQARLALLARRVQEADQGGDPWGESDGGEQTFS